MTWGNEEGNSGEGVESKYNEASYQMKRLDSLQAKINESKLNPLLIHPEEKTYGFNIIFNCLCSLFLEVSSKLDNKEFIQGKIYKNRISKFMKHNPVFEQKWQAGVNDYSLSFNHKNWEVLGDLLAHFEYLVRKFMENHKLTSPEAEDEGLF